MYVTSQLALTAGSGSHRLPEGAAAAAALFAAGGAGFGLGSGEEGAGARDIPSLFKRARGRPKGTKDSKPRKVCG